jgi:hypothetical protein
MLLRWLKSELITQPARKLFGWIGPEWTIAVQGALPAVCWEIFPRHQVVKQAKVEYFARQIRGNKKKARLFGRAGWQ